ncbi:protein turtle-like [Tachypleus tridentatus]|uniref:protein turtle-like n=1 Tax=Tachypleus tridentatus TaxID=6853 RepID=UPI003FCFB16D
MSWLIHLLEGLIIYQSIVILVFPVTVLNSEVSFLQAVVDSQVQLPCNISLPSEDDSISLVLWYKSGISAPIFSVDSRKGPLQKSKHFTSDFLGQRGYLDFSLDSDLAFLTIKTVVEEDEGDYNCRVDFRWGRTLKSAVKVEVIIPPRSVTITNEKNELLYGRIGPYDEGTSLILRCIAKGAKPSPTVTWWRDSIQIDDSFQEMQDHTVRNDYIVQELSKEDLMAEITCQASNTNLTSPKIASVFIDMNLKPVNVRLISTRRHFSAGRQFGVECQTTGSRPPAHITWWLGTRKMEGAMETVRDGGNRTVSNLVFTPSSDDNGKYLSCRVENPRMPGISKTDGLTLNVYYPPIMLVLLSPNQVPNKLYEGENIYLECKFQSNPKITKMEWQFKGSTLLTNTRAGVFVHNQSLVLENVRREQSGVYRCLADNIEGRGESKGLELKIKYSPVCKEGQKIAYAVTLDELVEISCEVEADPDDVTFTWTVNNTVENREVLSYDSSGLKSVARYIPRDENDFGFLTCKAQNMVGVQKEACIFTLLSVRAPEQVHNCTISNYSSDTLNVECRPGDDGGLEQRFYLEAYLLENKELQANVSRIIEPVFKLSGLTPGKSFVILVYSFNAKGRSPAVAISAQTQISARWHLDYPTTLKPHLGILVGVVAALVLLALIIVLLIRMKGEREESEKGDVSEGTVEDKYSAVSEDLGTSKNIDSSSDPDLIPLRNFPTNAEETDVLKMKEQSTSKYPFGNANRHLYYEKQTNYEECSDTPSPERHSLKAYNEDSGGFSEEELLCQPVFDQPATRFRSDGVHPSQRHLLSPRSGPWSDDDDGDQTELPQVQGRHERIKTPRYQHDNGPFYEDQGRVSATLPVRSTKGTPKFQHKKPPRNPKSNYDADINRPGVPISNQRSSLKHSKPEMQGKSCVRSNYRMSTPV